MPKSAAFARIKAQVLEIVATIPEAKLCSFQSIGDHLDVMPRHIAYILSQLDDHSKMVYPWHRVVSGDGSLGAIKRSPDGTPQAELLAQEGLTIINNAIVFEFARYAVPVECLNHGVPRQVRLTPAIAKRQRSLNSKQYRHR